MLGKLFVAAAILAALAGCSSVVEVPQPPTATEARELYDEMLERSWISTGLSERMTRPEVGADEPVEVNPWTQAVVTCMADEGYTQVAFHWEPDRGYYLDQVLNIESSVLEDAELRFFVCVSRHPLDVLSDDSLSTREQLEFQYDNYQRRIVPCLLVHGIPVSNTVTREHFVATQGSWNPYQELPVLTRTSPEFETLVAQCDHSRQPPG
jgi:hypothetical protein